MNKEFMYSPVGPLSEGQRNMQKLEQCRAKGVGL